jgi:hypothetical protein
MEGGLDPMASTSYSVIRPFIYSNQQVEQKAYDSQLITFNRSNFYVINSTYLQASDPNSMRDLGVAKNVEYKFDGEPSTSKNKTTLNFFDSD